MEKFFKSIIKNKIWVIIITTVILLASVVAFFFVDLNSDMISYLPQKAPAAQGLKYLSDEFGIKGDATLGVNNVTEEEMQEIVDHIKTIKGVSKDGVMWYGELMKITENSNPLIASLLPNLKDNKVVQNLFYPKDEGLNLEEGKHCYVAMLFFDVQSSSQEATNILNSIDVHLKDKNIEHAFGGSSQMTREIFQSIFSEIWKFALVGVLVVVIILFLTTTSFFEPLILLMTLGVSIIVNMGSNIIFPNVSTITFGISAILQLGLSMDYAIFLMHSFYEEKKLCLDDATAMARAMPKTFSTVFSSALTTVFGFIALFFMDFTMGADLGRVLAKGVFLSMLSVMLVQPCLTLLFRRPLLKHSHRIIVPRFSVGASFAIKHKKAILIVGLLLLIPGIIGQTNMKYSYMQMGLEKPNPTALEERTAVMGNSIIVIVPVEKGLDNLTKQKNFVKEIRKIENVEDIVSLYSMLPEDNLLIDKIVSENITTSDIFDRIVKDNHTMYSIMLKADIFPESDRAYKALEAVEKVVNSEEFFKNEKTYITGSAQAVRDLATITPRDFLIVSIVSIIAILLILILTLKSIKTSIILVLVIELGIVINLALCYFIPSAVDVNFMAYIVISSVQLGATVDYAILYTVKYMRLKKTKPTKEAAYEALDSSAVSIITSASIIAGACYSVSFITKNLIIKQITNLIGRGAIISSILVFLLLPGMLLLFSNDVSTKRISKYKRRKLLDKLTPAIKKEKSTK